MIFLIKITFMEIKEIVSYYLNSDSNILDVTFRTIEDSDDILRNDNIDYSIVDDYGYKLESDSFDFFDDDEFDDNFNDEKIELDEDELISFLNEYYTVNSHLIPKGETF